jgi:predicted secreted protein
MATVIKGDDFALYIEQEVTDGTTTTLEYIMVGCATSSSLSMSTETQGASCKGSGGWEEVTVTTKSWETGTDALYRINSDITGIDLFDMWEAGTLLKVQMGVGTSGGTVYRGTVYITSLEFNGPQGENTTLSASLKGTGPLVKATIA